MLRTRVLVGLVALVAIAVTACGSNNNSNAAGPSGPNTTKAGSSPAAAQLKIVTVGHLSMQTGAGSFTAEQTAWGLQLAQMEIKDSGYLAEDGVALEIKAKDTASEVATAVTAFNEFGRDGALVTYLPILTNVALALIPLANSAKTLLLTGAGTGTPEADWEFHLTDAITPAITLGKYLGQQGIQRLGVIVDADNPYFPAMIQSVKKGLEETGSGNVVRIESVGTAETDFAAPLTNLRNEKPDAIIIGTLAEQAGNVIRQMDQIGGFEHVVKVGSGAFGPKTYEIAGASAEGIVYFQNWVPGDAASSSFDTAFQAAYHKAPDQYAANAYQTMWLLATALKQIVESGGEITAAAIRDHIVPASTSAEFEGHRLFNGFSLDPSGATTYLGALVRVGKGGTVERIEG